MSTQTPRDISRRTWRTAIIVFLVVFLGGSGVTGAYALWSHQATVTATVTTGTWSEPLRPGWTWNPSITVKKVTSTNAHHQILIDWPDVASSTAVTYDPALTPQKNGQIQGFSTVPGDSSARQYEIHHNFADRYTFTVTATVDGVRSAPVTRTFDVNEAGVITMVSAG